MHIHPLAPSDRDWPIGRGQLPRKPYPPVNHPHEPLIGNVFPISWSAIPREVLRVPFHPSIDDEPPGAREAFVESLKSVAGFHLFPT
eukprot:8503203-Pyramimonas_sp.AAC.1